MEYGSNCVVTECEAGFKPSEAGDACEGCENPQKSQGDLCTHNCDCDTGFCELSGLFFQCVGA